jgi:fluoride exporter
MAVVLWVALGGALGSALRHGVNVGAGRAFGPEFPWATLIVNIVGCFAMGLLFGLMALRWNASAETRAFLATGILGGFTTFSAFSLDFALLVERNQLPMALLYGAGSVVLSLVAVFAGLELMRALGA